MCLSHIRRATHAHPQIDPFALDVFNRSCRAMVNAMAWYLSKSLDGPNAIIHAGTQLRVKYHIDELTVDLAYFESMAMEEFEDLAHFEILNETEAKLYTWNQENTLTLAHAND